MEIVDPANPLNQVVDLLFPLGGSTLPRDHGYRLYASIARVIPAIHQARDVGIFPVRGTSAGDGTLLLHDRSCLRLRLPSLRIPAMLPLAGKTLELDGHRLRVGVPSVQALVPAATLAAPLVLIKLAAASEDGVITPDRFLLAARKKLEELNVSAEPGLQVIRSGPRAGQVRRRVIHVKDQTHVGYAMLVRGLTAADSVLLQARGLGGRRLMGCGLFLPAERAG